MCLLIDKDAKPKVAAEDITVYKALNSRGISTTYWHKYEWDELYTTEFDFEEYGGVADETARQAAIEKYGVSWRWSIATTYVTRGFHSCKTPERAEKLKTSTGIIAKCTIPKGAEYYEDTSDLLVSNQIIVHGGA